MKRPIIAPAARMVPPEAIDRARVKWASNWVLRSFESRLNRPAPKRDAVPRYLRAVVDDDFTGPIG